MRATGLKTFFGFLAGALGLGAIARAAKGSSSASSSPSSSAAAVEAYPTRLDVVGHPPTEPQSSRPGTEAFRAYVLQRWGGRDLGIWASAQHLDQNATSEHNVGQAWDWGFTATADVQSLIDWLEANGDEMARRLGVGYLIFNRRMRRWYDPRGWASYTGDDPHTAHVHVSFSRAGAMGQTSGYSGGFLA